MLSKTDFYQQEVIIVLPNEKPVSQNKYYAGTHWSNRASDAKAAHWLIRSKIDPDWPMFDCPVKITMTVFAGDKRRRDVDNQSMKMYIDGLKGRLIEDDDWRFVRAVERIYEIDKKNPRVELRIERYENLEKG